MAIDIRRIFSIFLLQSGGVGTSHCTPAQAPAKVEFHPYPEVPALAVERGEQIMASGGLDVGGIEYLEAADGRQVFYDVNANSNLRMPIGQAFGFDPFERVVDYLIEQIEQAEGGNVTGDPTPVQPVQRIAARSSSDLRRIG